MMAFDDCDLEKLAMQEILKEAKRNADRAKEMGSLGWQKPGIPSTNKRFLSNMLVSTLRNPLRHRRRRQSQDSDREGRSGHSKHRRSRSRSRDSSDDSRHRKSRTRSRDSSTEDDRRRRMRSGSRESTDDTYRYQKRKHSGDRDHFQGHEKPRPYGRRYNGKYFPRGRGQGRGFQHRNSHRNGVFPGNFPGGDMDGFYHMEYMEYMNNYKKHMAFYDFMENEIDEKSAANFDNEESLSCFSDSDFSSDNAKNSHKEKEKNKQKKDKSSKEEMTDVHHEKQSEETLEGKESVSKKKRNKDGKSRHEDKAKKKKLENSKDKEKKLKEKESSGKGHGKRSWKFERADRKEGACTHIDQKEQEEIIVEDEFNAECYRTSDKKASEVEKSSTNRKSDISGSRNMDVYKKLNSAFSKKCNQNSTSDDPQKNKGKPTENNEKKTESNEGKNDNQSLSEGEILDSDDDNLQQDIETSKHKKSKKRKHSKHRKHKHKKHKRK